MNSNTLPKTTHGVDIHPAVYGRASGLQGLRVLRQIAEDRKAPFSHVLEHELMGSLGRRVPRNRRAARRISMDLGGKVRVSGAGER